MNALLDQLSERAPLQRYKPRRACSLARHDRRTGLAAPLGGVTALPGRRAFYRDGKMKGENPVFWGRIPAFRGSGGSREVFLPIPPDRAPLAETALDASRCRSRSLNAAFR